MVKGFIVAGTHSGCGKTIVTLGLLKALKEKRLRIQPFKVGPDYIDTSWHKQISGVASVNLDLFSMEKDFENWFWKYAKKAEISIIEGVMGLFDGDFSTFEVAKRLKLPVLLVIDVFGMAETVKAIALGFKKILQKEGIKLYLVLNRVSSERHLQRLLKTLKNFKVLGYLPKKPEFEIPSRHLGLYMPQDKIFTEEKISYLKETIEKNFDLETLLTLSSKKDFMSLSEPQLFLKVSFKKIAIAMDSVFCFYYTHLLDNFKEKFQVEFFSPLYDKNLPNNVDIIYIGGGYPELYIEAISENKIMKQFIKDWAEKGKCLYAECGGLIYLSKKVFYNGKNYPMVGVFPLEINMDRLHLGYREVKVLDKTFLFNKNMVFRGHEFHYTKARELKKIKKIYKVKDLYGNIWYEGYKYKNTIASYVHLINFIYQNL